MQINEMVGKYMADAERVRDQVRKLREALPRPPFRPIRSGARLESALAELKKNMKESKA